MSKCLSTAKNVPVFGKKSNIVNLSNDDDLSKNLADISFELEDNTYSKKLEINPNTNVLDEYENTSQGYYELSNDISHSNYFKSPLPKNIKQGKLFINNMKSNLLYKKTKVLDYDNTEYFLYHMPLMSCIQNILEIFDISQTFALEYEELYKTIKNKIMENSGKPLKVFYQLVQKFYPLFLYSDATNCDSLGKRQLHPIYLSLGNIPHSAEIDRMQNNYWVICQ
ncbi:zn-finger domain-containing protein [Gigaspora margarita]|uniref:Zn-finger domain-containing protein n=1 Tax=Gigaspora margarita TaxID=4874 RepID=A0A8H4AFN8_GIGMA|nr:zn-finger domain-containing protein [Gigaspora margarita]